MSEYIVTVIDTTGIQPYIFGSNKLRENIGASFLTSQTTKKWVKDALKDLGKPYYFPDPEWGEYIPDATPHIEQSGIIAEVIYAGGGNAVLLFKASDGNDYAKQFVRNLSNRVLKDAPGINLVVAHSEKFTWDNLSNSLCKRIQNLIENEIAQAKRERVPSSPLLGLGVTADCRSTRLVAVDTSNGFMDDDEGEGYLISSEVKQKLDAVKGANARLTKLFTDTFDQSVYEFPYRFDHLGRSAGDSSYLAVVHVDGNGMGDRFKQCGESASSDREYITKMRELSWNVQTIATDALRSLGKLLSESVTFEQDNRVIKSFGCNKRLIDKIPLKVAENDKIYLPFRPLVYGGDDVTFVCDGRLGLALATLFLKNFEKIAADGKKLTACAGVSIVKAHYPFARAYQLSESLCGSAKKFKKDQDSDTSAIDWHIAASGLLGDLGEIRKREYSVRENGDLTIRPLYLGVDSGYWRNWEDFQQVVTELNTHDNWCDRRNKVIALREILRQGETATEQFLGAYGLPDLPVFTISDDDFKRKGWTDDIRNNESVRVCAYFDAIEAMEFYLPLSGGES